MNPETMNQLIRDKARLVESCIVGCIESIEGRVPTDEEVALFGQRLLSEQKEEFLWKGVVVVRVTYWPAPQVPYKVESLVDPFDPVKVLTE